MKLYLTLVLSWLVIWGGHSLLEVPIAPPWVFDRALSPLTVNYWLSAVGACFMHASFLHWFYNSLFFLPAALYIEALIGFERGLIIFILCGLGGSIGFDIQSAFGASSVGLAVGASGGIYGMWVTALLLLGQKHPKTMQWLLPCFFFNLAATAFLSDPIWSDVAHWGHFGGAISAFPSMALWGTLSKTKK